MGYLGMVLVQDIPKNDPGRNHISLWIVLNGRGAIYTFEYPISISGDSPVYQLLYKVDASRMMSNPTVLLTPNNHDQHAANMQTMTMRMDYFRITREWFPALKLLPNVRK